LEDRKANFQVGTHYCSIWWG